MNDAIIKGIPTSYRALEAKCQEIGFTMPSDLYIGAFLKTLIASKPKGRFLELGTGIGLSLCWMIDGLDEHAQLTSIDNDPQLIEIAQSFFGADPRVTLVCEDGATWIQQYQGDPFDLIFADAWPGKYSQLAETLALLKVGGYYVVDDLSPADNWPEGHAEKVDHFMEYLENRSDVTLTKMNWSTGVLMAVKHK